jgi:hypothetical protein
MVEGELGCGQGRSGPVAGPGVHEEWSEIPGRSYPPGASRPLHVDRLRRPRGRTALQGRKGGAEGPPREPAALEGCAGCDPSPTAHGGSRPRSGPMAGSASSAFLGEICTWRLVDITTSRQVYGLEMRNQLVRGLVDSSISRDIDKLRRRHGDRARPFGSGYGREMSQGLAWGWATCLISQSADRNRAGSRSTARRIGPATRAASGAGDKGGRRRGPSWRRKAKGQVEVEGRRALGRPINPGPGRWGIPGPVGRAEVGPGLSGFSGGGPPGRGRASSRGRPAVGVRRAHGSPEAACEVEEGVEGDRGPGPRRPFSAPW